MSDKQDNPNSDSGGSNSGRKRGQRLYVESEFIHHAPGKYVNLYRQGMVIPWDAKRRIYDVSETEPTAQRKPMLPDGGENGGEVPTSAETESAQATAGQNGVVQKEVKGSKGARSKSGKPESPAVPFWQELENASERKRYKVIEEAALDALKDGGKSVDRDLSDRNAKIYEKLLKVGEYRRVGMLRKTSDLDQLRLSHPHFGPVIDFVGNRLLMSRHSRRPQRIPPILLAGPPGIGKTHFCDALASILGVPCRRHQMDQAETSSALLGSEKTWGNSTIGLVFEQVMLGEYANPIVILDELDKAATRSSHSAPAAVLHTLLEPLTASRVRDLSVDLEFDAGLITWVATANDPARIPRTLLSRMKCFWIGMPNAEQAMLIVQAVAAHAVKAAGVPGFITPSRALLSEIAHYSARQIYQIVSEVIARCVTEGRKQMTLSDLEKWIYRDDEDPDSKGGEGKGGEGKEKVTLH